jgi:hypothetical protein
MRTKQTNYPWWKADILQKRHIKTVMIVNRRDDHSDLLSSFRIHVGNSSNMTNNPYCQNKNFSLGGIFAYDLKGRYVGIRLMKTNQRQSTKSLIFARLKHLKE